MANPKRVAVIVTLPPEIDITNCVDVYMQLCSAVAPGITIVVADMTRTTFCDASGIREISHARQYAADASVDLRSVIPAGSVLHVLKLLGLGQVWRPYPTLAAALERELGREIETPHHPAEQAPRIGDATDSLNRKKPVTFRGDRLPLPELDSGYG